MAVSWKPLMHSNPKAMTSAISRRINWPVPSDEKASKSSTIGTPSVVSPRLGGAGGKETRRLQRLWAK